MKTKFTERHRPASSPTRRAFFLVATLSTVTFLSVVVTQMTDMVFQSANITHSVKENISADSICDAALEIVKSILREDINKNGYDFYSEDFSNTEELWSKTYILPVNVIYGVVRAVITDESGKFNVNSLVDTRGSSEGLAKGSYLLMLQKLFKLLKLDETMAGYILDWIDADSSGMFEQLDSRNWFIPDVQEIIYLLGKISQGDVGLSKIFSNYFEGREDATGSPYLTLWPYAGAVKINVNTSPKEVIASVIDTPDSMDIAQKIDEERRKNPFRSFSEFLNFLQKFLPVSRERFFNVDPSLLFDVRSEIFSVKIYCKEKNVQTGIFAVVFRPYGGEMKTLAFRRF